MKTGDTVIWICTPRGGYGYSYPVNGRVVKVGARRVLIEVPLARGGHCTRWVKPASLRARE